MKEESQELAQYARGYVTVDLDAIVSNMHHMKANLAEQTKMMGVIKTDGYGHGAVPIARQLEKLDFVFGLCSGNTGGSAAFAESRNEEADSYFGIYLSVWL